MGGPRVQARGARGARAYGRDGGHFLFLFTGAGGTGNAFYFCSRVRARRVTILKCAGGPGGDSKKYGRGNNFHGGPCKTVTIELEMSLFY